MAHRDNRSDAFAGIGLLATIVVVVVVVIGVPYKLYQWGGDHTADRLEDIFETRVGELDQELKQRDQFIASLALVAVKKINKADADERRVSDLAMCVRPNSSAYLNYRLDMSGDLCEGRKPEKLWVVTYTANHEPVITLVE